MNTLTHTREIRALYNCETIRVYQAYNNEIADAAIKAGTFVAPFKMTRMTWIKPSFLWMMYRAGWGRKDSGQHRILAIDISREGFDWALEHSLLSHPNVRPQNKKEWENLKVITPVRIQWDPERDLDLNPLPHRAIQIGLSGKAVEKYVNNWIQNIEDITEFSAQLHTHLLEQNLKEVERLLPKEIPYPVSEKIASKLEMPL